MEEGVQHDPDTVEEKMENRVCGTWKNRWQGPEWRRHPHSTFTTFPLHLTSTLEMWRSLKPHSTDHQAQPVPGMA